MVERTFSDRHEVWILKGTEIFSGDKQLARLPPYGRWLAHILCDGIWRDICIDVHRCCAESFVIVELDKGIVKVPLGQPLETVSGVLVQAEDLHPGLSILATFGHTMVKSVKHLRVQCILDVLVASFPFWIGLEEGVLVPAVRKLSQE